MDFEDIARQGEDIAKAEREGREAAVQRMAQRFGITPELARYLLELEAEIHNLKKQR